MKTEYQLFKNATPMTAMGSPAATSSASVDMDTQTSTRENHLHAPSVASCPMTEPMHWEESSELAPMLRSARSMPKDAFAMPAKVKAIVMFAPHGNM